MHQFWLAGGTTNEVESTWRHMAAMESGEMTRTGSLAFVLPLFCAGLRAPTPFDPRRDLLLWAIHSPHLKSFRRTNSACGTNWGWGWEARSHSGRWAWPRVH